jgi:hypothetical protein
MANSLLWAIILLNIASTSLHYIDNARFLPNYPGPDWFTPQGIIATLLIMTIAGVVGCWFYYKRAYQLAYGLLGAYSITGLSSPGHYLYPMSASMSAKMQVLIWLDFSAALCLVLFIIGSSWVSKNRQEQA